MIDCFLNFNESAENAEPTTLLNRKYPQRIDLKSKNEEEISILSEPRQSGVSINKYISDQFPHTEHIFYHLESEKIGRRASKNVTGQRSENSYT